MVNEGHSLLAEAAGRFRSYEAQHRDKAARWRHMMTGPDSLRKTQGDIDDTIAKAERNAEIAGRIEAYLVGAAVKDACEHGTLDPPTFTAEQRQRAINALEAGPIGFTEWGKIVDDVARELGLVRSERPTLKEPVGASAEQILIGDAYQVVGVLAQRWPADDPEITRVLDVLADGKGELLPFHPLVDGDRA